MTLIRARYRAGLDIPNTAENNHDLKKDAS